MEMVQSAPETFTSSVRKKNLLPLNQLLEDTRKSSSVPHHLLETKVFAKVKSNGVIQAEPSEVHFSGFEIGKDYKKILKLVNISSEVLSVHILAPQTKNFQIKYTKKCRLVPGLSYTVTVNFHPDEWRYFFDNIRIHCKGDENLLVPVHAYPVINDLHVPSHISLPPVPLGQSISHVIPLQCSCPIDFEFQVHCLQPNEAFTVSPLSGIIPANGKMEIKVTFTPLQYCTADITLQLVICQFNSKPVIWTVTGSSSPHQQLSKNDGENNVSFEEQKVVEGKSLPVASHQESKTAPTLMKGGEKKRKAGVQRQVTTIGINTRTSDVNTHTDLVGIQSQDKQKDLIEAVSNINPVSQTEDIKDDMFIKKVKLKQERANQNRRQVSLGDVPTEQKLKVVKMQDKIKHSSKVTASSRSSPKRTSRRDFKTAAQLPQCTAVLSTSDTGRLRRKALRLFQYAAREVIRQCRENKKHQADQETDEKLLLLTPENLLPFIFPTFESEEQPDELAANALGQVPVRMPCLDIKFNPPIFSPKAPQHHRLMSYQPVSVYDAATTVIPSNLCRPLRTGAEDELLPLLLSSSVELIEDEEDRNAEEHDEDQGPSLSFLAPEALLKPANAHPLQIFNPAPHVFAYKPAPMYLECNLDFHLCPLPRYAVPKDKVVGTYSPATQRKFLDRKDIIKGILTWKKFPSIALNTISSMSSLTGDLIPRMSDAFANTLLPAEAPPSLQNLPDCIRNEIQAGPSDSSELSLTPQMVEAEFGLSERSSSLMKLEEEEGNRTPITPVSRTSSRESREQRPESNHNNSLRVNVLDRLKQLKSLDTTSSHPP